MIANDYNIQRSIEAAKRVHSYPNTDDGELALNMANDLYKSREYNLRVLANNNIDNIDKANELAYTLRNNLNTTKYTDEMPAIVYRDSNSPTGWTYADDAVGVHSDGIISVLDMGLFLLL